MNEKSCCPPRPKPDKKEPFPTMSAHFAHTLDDMKDKYLAAQYITIDSEVGTLDPEILKKLLFSRSNMVVYQNRIFRFANQEGYLCKYINLYNLDQDNFYKAQQVNIDSLTGSWQVIDLESDSKSELIIVEEQIINIKNDINNITENITNITTNIDSEIEERKAADEQIIQDTTTSFNVVKDELEVMDEEIQNEISARESVDEQLRVDVDSNKENIKSNTRDIETLEQGFETVDEALTTLKEGIDKNGEDIKSLEAGFKSVDEDLEKMEDSITNVTTKVDDVTEKVDNIGQSLNMDGGEVVIPEEDV